MGHNYGPGVLEPRTRSCGAQNPQLLSPCGLELMLHKRSHHSEEPAHRNSRRAPGSPQLEKRLCSNEAPAMLGGIGGLFKARHQRRRERLRDSV